MIKELTASIYQHGLLNPIIVRPIEDGFEIVAGNRRFEACKLLHWKHIPAKIKELSEKDAFEIQLVENIQRQTMNPIEEARAFKKYTSEFGWGGESELARKISKSEQYVSNRIQLLRLPKDIIDELSDNKIKVSHALELVNLNEEEQKIVKKSIIGENMTVRDIREIKRQTNSNKIKEAIDHDMMLVSENYPTQLSSDNEIELTARSVRQQRSILEKAHMCLRISLYRLDSLVHESDKKLDGHFHSEVHDILMDYRLKIHSMMDDNIKAMSKVEKNCR
jgi:ParB family transcriptional regulator, chromosome partitioning protein